MTMPRCSFWASPASNRERAAGLCASVSVTAWLRIVLGHRLLFCSPNREMVEGNGLDARVAKQAVDEAVAIALFRERVLQELEDVVVPVRAAQPMRLRPPRIRRICSSGP
jgi:hypothetical protein